MRGIVLAVALAFWPMIGKGAELRGFGDVHFGMNKDQVLSILSDRVGLKVEWDDKEKEDDIAYQTNIGGVPYAVTVSLKDNSVYRVWVKLETPRQEVSGEECGRLFLKLHNVIVERYGRPVETPFTFTQYGLAEYAAGWAVGKRSIYAEGFYSLAAKKCAAIGVYYYAKPWKRSDYLIFKRVDESKKARGAGDRF
jgi:hypothetical protein